MAGPGIAGKEAPPGVGAREYLERVKELERQADECGRRVDALEARAEGLASPTVTGMPRGSSLRTNEGYIIALARARDEHNAAWDRYIDARADAKRRIRKVKDRTLGKLLMLRYVDFAPWNAVADALGYSEEHARGYLLQKALREFGRRNRDI